MPGGGMNQRREKAQILDAAGITRVITRIAHEIVERNKGVNDLVLIGLRSRGVDLAHRVAVKLEEIEGNKVAVGALDITLYRDDLGKAETQPTVRRTEIPFPINEKKVVLVDDVLFRPVVSGGHGRPDGPGPTVPDPARRPGGPGPPRVADPGRLRREERADLPPGAGAGLPDRRGRRGPRGHFGAGGILSQSP